jgi:hypothetical protein
MDVPLAPPFLEWYSSQRRTAVRTFLQTAGTLILIATLCATGTARAGFAPIPLSAGSFNESMIVPASSPAPVIPGGYTTASMDAGLANTGTSWYEQSYNTSAPTTGLPHPGAILTSQSLPNHSYVMAPSYTANNAVMLDSTLTNATLVLASPAAYGGLSLLESGGNNGVSFTYTVGFELKVDNFNLDQSPVAVISVVNADTQTVLASENLTRNQFSNTLYQTFSLGFNAVAGAHYDFRTWWNFSPAAPRLTQRSVMLRPGPVPFFAAVSGTSAVTMNLIGTPDGTLTVQRATHLISGPWLPIGTVTVPAYLGSVQFTDPAPSATSFYRLVLP